MPVAAPSQQKDPQVPYCHLLPKPPGPGGYPAGPTGHLPHPSQISPTGVQDSTPYVSDTFNQLNQYEYGANAGSTSNASDVHAGPAYFNPHSPPILNLSPNLSPTEIQRSSPIYDLRETTRRRSLQGESTWCF